jgi:hypothetical protein
MSHSTHDQRIIELERTVQHLNDELISHRNQLAFVSQIVADLHETCNLLVKKAVMRGTIEIEKEKETATSIDTDTYTSTSIETENNNTSPSPSPSHSHSHSHSHLYLQSDVASPMFKNKATTAISPRRKSSPKKTMPTGRHSVY